jgi:Rps23 Pro-64 3,4-dihydroxylase Tpa1-like proline 4-hydroxylase
MLSLAVNPTLELNLARDVFKKHGRVLVERFLTPTSAQALAQAMRGFPYHQTMNRPDDTAAKIDETDIAARGQEFRDNLLKAVYARGTASFQYFYSQFEFDKHTTDATELGAVSKAAFEFLNGEMFLKAVGKIVAMPDLKSVHAQATCYAPGHFLTAHDDDVRNSGRRAAFVLYLNDAWRADWGGLLQFIDRDGHVAEAYTPLFNALALFRVPSQHSVSMVTPLAPVGRYAISGWVL